MSSVAAVADDDVDTVSDGAECVALVVKAESALDNRVVIGVETSVDVSLAGAPTLQPARTSTAINVVRAI